MIDPGFARISRYSYRSKLQRLPIEPISQASAKQRAGRCGRVRDGIAVRLYAEQEFLQRPEFTDPEILRTAEKVIFPGVGEASTAMRYLRDRGLDKLLVSLKQPVLGICLGLQLMCQWSEEGDTQALGIFNSRVKKFPPDDKVPHMGWNAVSVRQPDPLTDTLDGQWFYFVHSFAAPVGDWTLATSKHGRPFSAMVRQGNFCGAQFHPERSASAGAALLRRFMETGGG